MAKESMKAKERKRAYLSARYDEKRSALRKAAGEGDWDAMFALQKLPKNSMPIRKHNRCLLTGRPRGYMRQFGISRVTFREMALSGQIPGVTKASW
jgi:small subunit ribosomal protein S14